MYDTALQLAACAPCHREQQVLIFLVSVGVCVEIIVAGHSTGRYCQVLIKLKSSVLLACR
jgi:hypothetical protein